MALTLRRTQREDSVFTSSRACRGMRDEGLAGEVVGLFTRRPAATPPWEVDMAMTIGRNAIWAAILCGALLAPVAPALGDGGGFSAADLATLTEPQLVFREQLLVNELKKLKPPPGSPDEARYQSSVRSSVRKELRKVRAELEKRGEPPSATPAASSGTPAASSATPAASTPPTPPTPPAQASAPPLTPPTASTPEPTASSGNCQAAAACADEEARQRQAKAETKRTQAAAVNWAEQQGFIKK